MENENATEENLPDEVLQGEQSEEAVEEETGEEAALEDDSGDDAAAGTKEEDQKQKTGFQKRIDELTAKRREAERKYEEARARLEALERSQTATPELKAGEKPNPDDYEDYDQYVEALAEYKAAEQLRGYVQQTAQAREEAALNAKLQQGKLKYEDFDAVVRNENVPLPAHVVKAANASPMTADILYAVAKDPQTAYRLASLDPYAAAVEIGKIEIQLRQQAQQQQPGAGNQKPPKKTISEAAPPINPLSGSGTAGVKTIYDPNLSYEDYVKMRMGQAS